MWIPTMDLNESVNKGPHLSNLFLVDTFNMCAVLIFCDPLSCKLLIGDELISSVIWCK